MKLLLDEMHAPRVAARLRDRGHDAVAVKERAGLIGMSDEDLLRAATVDQRAVVTENVKDFAPLHQYLSAAQQQHAGLIFTHPRRFPRSAPDHARVLADALGAFLVEHAPMLGDVGSFVWWLDAAADAELIAAYRRQPADPALALSAARLAARAAPEW